MRTIPNAIGAAFVLGTMMLTVTGVFAQTDQATTDETSREAIAECLFGRMPVQNAPFSAEVTIAWRPPANSGRSELRANARYYRDREGRVRVEQGFAGDPFHLNPPGFKGQSHSRVIVTADGNWRAYAINPTARTSYIYLHDLTELIVGSGCRDHFVLPLSARRVISFSQRPVNQESLGEQVMSGVLATGTRFTTELPLNTAFGYGRAERWVSPELKLVVYLRSEESKMGTFEYRLTRISQAEPNPDLFDVPECEVTGPEDRWPWPCTGGRSSTAESPLSFETPYTALAKHRHSN